MRGALLKSAKIVILSARSMQFKMACEAAKGVRQFSRANFPKSIPLHRDKTYCAGTRTPVQL